MATSRAFPIALISLACVGATALLSCSSPSDLTTATSAEALAVAATRPSTELVARSTVRPRAQLAAADVFQFSAGDVHATYSQSSGGPVFVYRDADRCRVFRGSDISTESTSAGTMVSVVTHLSIDTGSTTFSVLIPRVQVRSDASTPVQTVAITTFHWFSVLHGEEEGQLDHFGVTPLEGIGTRSLLAVPAEGTRITQQETSPPSLLVAATMACP